MHYNQAIEALRAAIERVDKVLSKKEWHTSEEREALDAMKQAFDDTAALEIDNATMMIMDIREVLWPIDNLNKEWSADTLDEIAEILRPWLPSIEGILAEVIRTKKAITIARGELKIRIYPAKATVSTKPISNILEVRSPTDKKNSKARK